MNAESLIHSSFSIYSLNDLALLNKGQVLSNIQYWKNFLLEKKVKKLTIIDHITFDSVSIFFASLELGLQVITAARTVEQIEKVGALVDLVLVSNDINKGLNLQLQNLLVYTESPLRDLQYQPNNINPNAIVLSGFTSGSTGTPKLVSHTAETIVAASKLASELFRPNEKFLTHSNFNHLGVISMGVMGPIIGGVRLMTSQHQIHDLIFYASRGLVNKALLFEFTMAELKNHYVTEGLLSGLEIITGGKLLTASFIDWAFLSGVKKIYSVYGATECLPPVITKIVESTEVENLVDMGKVLGVYETKIVNGQLHLRGPGVSSGVNTVDGFYNSGDYVTEDDGSFLFRGRRPPAKELLDESEYMVMFDSLLNQCVNTALKKFIFSEEYKLSANSKELVVSLHQYLDKDCIDEEKLSKLVKDWCNLELRLVSKSLRFNEIKTV